MLNRLCFVVWEEWASWRETEAKKWEGKSWEASKSLEFSACLLTSSSSSPGSIFCTRSSCWWQIGALSWLSWSFHVAVHATCCCRYVTGSCSPSSSCLNLQAFLGLPSLSTRCLNLLIMNLDRDLGVVFTILFALSWECMRVLWFYWETWNSLNVRITCNSH